MTGRALVPKTASEPEGAETLLDLLRALAQQVTRWVETETALLRAETSAMMRRVVAGCIAFLALFATMIAALVCLAVAGVVALAPLLGGIVPAALFVSLVLFLLVLFLGYVAQQLLRSSKVPGSSLTAWLRGPRDEGVTK